MHEGAGREDPLRDRVGLVGDQALGEQRAEPQAPSGNRLLLLQGHRKTLQRPRRLAGAGVASLGGLRRGPEVLVIAFEKAVDRGLDRVGAGGDGVEDLHG